MAIVTATKTGNWSDNTVWGTPPTTGDTVRTSTFTVTIDQDINIGSGTLEATSSGFFSVTAARNITANILSSSGHTGGACVRCSHTTGTVAITGTVTAGPNVGLSTSGAGTVTISGAVTGGSANSAYGVSMTGTGPVTVNNNVTAGSGGSGANGINNNSTGAITVVGNVTGGGGSGTNAIGVNVTGGANVTITGTVSGGSTASSVGLAHSSTGTIAITGNVSGGSASSTRGVSVTGFSTTSITGNITGGSATSAQGVYNNGNGTVTITGNSTGGSNASAYGTYNSGSGTTTISGEATGGTGAGAYGAINDGTGTLRVGTAVGNDYGPSGSHSNSAHGLSGSNAVGSVTTFKKLKFGAHGQAPVTGCAYVEYSAGNNTEILYRDSSTQLALSDALTFTDLPATGDVRSGVTYNAGTRTGTLAVPAANQVAVGVSVDNTVGTAVLTTADIPTAIQIADAVLKRGVSNVEATASAYSLAEVILALLNCSSSGSTWTIKKTGGATFSTHTLTEDGAALPVTGVS